MNIINILDKAHEEFMNDSSDQNYTHFVETYKVLFHLLDDKDKVQLLSHTIKTYIGGDTIDFFDSFEY